MSRPPSESPAPPASPRPRPLALGQIFEIAIRILRRHAGVVLLVSLLLVGPGAILSAATGVSFGEVVSDILDISDDGTVSAPAFLTQAEADRLVAAAATFFLANAFAGVLGALAALGFSAIVGADHQGSSIGLAGALRGTLRRGLTALGIVALTTVLVVLIVGAAVIVAFVAIDVLTPGAIEDGGPGVFLALVVGVATVIAVAYLTMRWAVALPAAIIEERGAIESLVRSWELTTDRVWRTFAAVVSASLGTLVLGALLSNLLGLVVVDLLATSLGLDLRVAEAVISAAAAVILAPLVPVVSAVLFYDLRGRLAAARNGQEGRGAPKTGP